MSQLRFVSIIVPCNNEVKFISSCLDSIIANDYPADRMEVLVVDGMSEDGTREIVEGYAQQHKFIQVLDNSHRITPCALKRIARIGNVHSSKVDPITTPHHCVNPSDSVYRRGARKV